MADTDFEIRTIESKRYRGVYLQVDGTGIKAFDSNGVGRVATGHGKGPLGQFKIKKGPADISSYITTLEAAHQPNIYVRMDARSVEAVSAAGSGLVNLQFGHSAFEDFKIHVHPDGTRSFESTTREDVFLSIHMPEDTGQTHPIINCQYGCGPNEKFIMRSAPETMSLRALTYNTHLMKDSFLEMGAKISGDAVVFEDDIRRESIIRKVIETQADIVSLQEVWDLAWEQWFIDRLTPTYLYAYYGPTKNQGAYTGTSGVVLLSKFPLSESYTQGFPGMSGSENMSQKGVLCVTAEITGLGKIRIGTMHASTDTGGTGCLDLVMLRERTTTDIPAFRSMPALYLGDFNAHPNKYPTQKNIFSFPDSDVYGATDCWKQVNDEKINGSTVDMRHNKLDQFFSPMRDTADPSVIDYIWAKTGAELSLTPVSSTIFRDWNYISSSGKWCWAHKTQSAKGLSCAMSDDRLCVVTNSGSDDVNHRYELQYSVFSKADMKWRHGNVGCKTTTGPGVVYYGGKFHVFYRDYRGRAIFHRSSIDGISWGSEQNIGHDSGGSVCPIVFKDKLYIFYVDADGKADGGQIRFITKLNNSDNWGKENFSGHSYIGIVTKDDLSAATNGITICVVAKEGIGTGGVMRSVLMPDGNWNHTRIADRKTGVSSQACPGILSTGEDFHIFYQDPGGNAIFTCWSMDGLTWMDANQNIGCDNALGAMAATLWDGRTLVFYGFHRRDGGRKYKMQTLMHTEARGALVDLSDHYPMMTDLEIKKRTVLLNVSVHENGMGNVLYTDSQWAGTKHDKRPLKGFTIRPASDITLRYKASIFGEGEPAWVNQGQYAGTHGESKIMKGFAIELTGESASKYNLKYRAHIQGTGDTEFVSAGNYCGTNEQKQVEAIWIQLDPK